MTDTAAPLTPITPSNVNAVKPGYLTSEFWLKLLATLLTFLYASGVIPTTGIVAQAFAIAATMLGALGYSVVRTALKARALTAANDNAPATSTTVAVRTAQAGFARFGMLSLLAALGLAGALMVHASCGAAQTGAVAVIDCTIADGTKIKALANDLACKVSPTLAKAIGATCPASTAPPITWAEVVSEAEANGKVIGGCALATLVQTYMTDKATQAAAPSNADARSALEQLRVDIAGGATFHTKLGDL